MVDGNFSFFDRPIKRKSQEAKWENEKSANIKREKTNRRENNKFIEKKMLKKSILSGFLWNPSVHTAISENK